MYKIESEVNPHHSPQVLHHPLEVRLSLALDRLRCGDFDLLPSLGVPDALQPLPVAVVERDSAPAAAPVGARNRRRLRLPLAPEVVWLAAGVEHLLGDLEAGLLEAHYGVRDVDVQRQDDRLHVEGAAEALGELREGR